MNSPGWWHGRGKSEVVEIPIILSLESNSSTPASPRVHSQEGRTAWLLWRALSDKEWEGLAQGKGSREVLTGEGRALTQGQALPSSLVFQDIPTNS